MADDLELTLDLEYLMTPQVATLQGETEPQTITHPHWGQVDLHLGGFGEVG